MIATGSVLIHVSAATMQRLPTHVRVDSLHERVDRQQTRHSLGRAWEQPARARLSPSDAFVDLIHYGT